MTTRRIALTVGAATMHVHATVTGAVTNAHHYLRDGDRAELWRVRGNVVRYDGYVSRRAPPKLLEGQGATCARCRARKLRKGGRNINHRFVCADCL